MFLVNFKSPDDNLCILCDSSGKQHANTKEQEYDHTENNPVISKHLEIIFPDIAHQELDCNNGYRK